VIVQRRCTSCCSSVENIPLQAERHSARRQKLFAFPPESAFAFRPECCSESQRNRVRLQSGIAFTFDRIPHRRWEAGKNGGAALGIMAGLKVACGQAGRCLRRDTTDGSESHPRHTAAQIERQRVPS